MPLLTLVVHSGGQSVLSAYMGQRFGPKALQLVGVTENASGPAQKPEQAVEFGLPRVSVCVVDQMQR